jgi:hypothetical protein
MNTIADRRLDKFYNKFYAISMADYFGIQNNQDQRLTLHFSFDEDNENKMIFAVSFQKKIIKYTILPIYQKK